MLEHISSELPRNEQSSSLARHCPIHHHKKVASLYPNGVNFGGPNYLCRSLFLRLHMHRASLPCPSFNSSLSITSGSSRTKVFSSPCASCTRPDPPVGRAHLSRQVSAFLEPRHGHCGSPSGVSSSSPHQPSTGSPTPSVSSPFIPGTYPEILCWAKNMEICTFGQDSSIACSIKGLHD